MDLIQTKNCRVPHMSKRVAILLAKYLSRAVLGRCIEAAETEPYWLRPDQYHECDGGVQLQPELAGDLIAHAERNHFLLCALASEQTGASITTLRKEGESCGL